DYYPYGMLLPKRHGAVDDYRYGFNGMEIDNEVKGEGNSYDFGARMYDPRVGRWFAPDKFEVKYPFQSTYAFVSNNPMVFIDPDGNTDINIHLVRIYRDGKTAISLMKVEIEGQESKYFAVVAKDDGNLTKDGVYPGYLIRTVVMEKYRGYIKNGKYYGDGPETVERMQNVSAKMKIGDDRVPKAFQKGIETGMGNNGIRIYDDKIPYQELKSRTISKGGTRTFHAANNATQVFGCEGVGEYLTPLAGNHYLFGVGYSQSAIHTLLNTVLDIYETDITNDEATRLTITVETQISEIEPGQHWAEPLYKKLFPPRPKAVTLPLIIQAKGIKEIKTEIKVPEDFKIENNIENEG
ncbi:RHS repeat-associated core domain-containing protein, partial [Psychroserpens algicola]